MDTATRTAVFIVDDVPTMRERLRELIGDIEGVHVVGDAGTPADAIEAIQRTHPDCVLLDYQLDGGTGVDVLRAVHPSSPDIVFIVLTNHATTQHRRACLDAGARFFFDKSAEFGQVCAAIANSTRRTD
ncbi:MAG TPA: response regulator transcription factor [Casimicrobiaceae bacterium]|nr:response regulator transcription factor [Casimicrobiaceae bacterium]